MNDSPLVRVVEAIEALCEDGHLAPPGTIILSPNKATIMPESTTPISTLLLWADHLDGRVRFEAANLSPGLNGINAIGTLEGLPVTISATTTQPFPKGWEPWMPAPIQYMRVLELSLNESI